MGEKRETSQVDYIFPETRSTRWTMEEMVTELMDFYGRYFVYEFNEAMTNHDYSSMRGKFLELTYNKYMGVHSVSEISSPGSSSNVPSSLGITSTSMAIGSTSDDFSASVGIKSGNWRFRALAVNWGNLYKIRLTRVGDERNLGDESTKLRVQVYLSGPDTSHKRHRLIDFHSAAKSMEELGVGTRSGTHNLREGDVTPDPPDYVMIDRNSVKWDLKTG